MKAITQNEVKNNIYKIFETVRKGEDIIIKGDSGKENFAVIIPYKNYENKKYRKLGILKGKASYKLNDDFKITEEELLTL